MTSLTNLVVISVLFATTISLSHQLHYATTRGPSVACYQKQIEYRPVVVQKPTKGCLTADFAVFCEFDWDNSVFPHEVKKEVCCKGYIERNGVCVPKCSDGCSYGTCVAPDTCHCVMGYTGFACKEMVETCSK